MSKFLLHPAEVSSIITFRMVSVSDGNTKTTRRKNHEAHETVDRPAARRGHDGGAAERARLRQGAERSRHRDLRRAGRQHRHRSERQHRHERGRLRQLGQRLHREARREARPHHGRDPELCPGRLRLRLLHLSQRGRLPLLGLPGHAHEGDPPAGRPDLQL